MEHVPELESLYLTCNRISTTDALRGLEVCSSLSVLDLAKNQLEDDGFVEVIKKLPNLRVLIMTGNPITRTMHQYRKTIINACPQLTYLDERPVFEDERRTAQAFFRGGPEEEREEHRLILAEKRAADRRQFISMQAFLSGKPRDECLRLGQEAYDAVLDNYHKTGNIDLHEVTNELSLQEYDKTHRIWKDMEVETVSREFFEGRVSIRIGMDADELSESVPDLEAVETEEAEQPAQQAPEDQKN